MYPRIEAVVQVRSRAEVEGLEDFEEGKRARQKF